LPKCSRGTAETAISHLHRESNRIDTFLGYFMGCGSCGGCQCACWHINIHLSIGFGCRGCGCGCVLNTPLNCYATGSHTQIPRYRFRYICPAVGAPADKSHLMFTQQKGNANEACKRYFSFFVAGPRLLRFWLCNSKFGAAQGANVQTS